MGVVRELLLADANTEVTNEVRSSVYYKSVEILLKKNTWVGRLCIAFIEFCANLFTANPQRNLLLYSKHSVGNRLFFLTFIS